MNIEIELPTIRTIVKKNLFLREMEYNMLLTNSKAPISVLPLSYKVYSFFLDLLILMIPRTIRKIYIETNEVEVNISRNFLLEFFKFIKIHT